MLDSSFKFGEAGMLMGLWLVALLFFVGWLGERSRDRALRKYFGKKASFLVQSLSPQKRGWHLLLQTAALICFVVALARPLMGSKQQEVKQTGIEMVIALDVSNSMLAEDDKPSRLEHAKHEISHLLDELGGDKVGLIAFAGSAVLVSPMTSDHSALKLFLSSLNPNSVSSQGTNFKDVVEEAVRALDRGGVDGDGAKSTRVLLIASDGEDNEPGGLEEVKAAYDKGLRVFALGFGSAQGAPIPFRDEAGQLTGYKKDRSGQVVMSMPSDAGLAKLTQAGGGSYYHSSFDEGEVKTMIQDLDHLQKTDFKTRMSTEYDEKFQIPLLFGLLFAFLDLLFGERKTGPPRWRGRFEVTQ